MAQSSANTNRLADGTEHFVLGANSLWDASKIPDGQFPWGFNVMTTNGHIGTRFGMDSILRNRPGNAQGFTIFTPSNGHPTFVWAVSGKIFISPYPFTSCSILPNITFHPTVDHVVFKEAIQAKDLTGVITPRKVLIMQDGRSRAAFWDGSESRHLDPDPNGAKETKLGLWMEWVGSRLWVANGPNLYASDIYDPLHFVEAGFLAGGGPVQAIDGNEITALKRTSDLRQLLIWTLKNTTTLDASNTVRSSWATTPNFITLKFPGVGCVAGKSPCDMNGEVWWYSAEGVRRFNAVGAALQDSRNPIASREMQRSQLNMSPIQSRACGFGFGFYGGFSVPSGDIYNRHSWVLDSSSSDFNIQRNPIAWQGVWTGTRPVEWATDVINGKARCFHLSQDPDGPRIWECFNPNRLDNGNPIECFAELRAHDFGDPAGLKRFLFSEIHLDNVQGDGKLFVDYRSEFTCWRPIMEYDFCAKTCKMLDCNVKSFTAFQEQSRHLFTQDAPRVCAEGAAGMDDYTGEVGMHFQIRLRWTGRMSLHIYRMWANKFEEKTKGQCKVGDKSCLTLECCQPEPNYRALASDTPCDYYYANSEPDTGV